MFYVYVFVEEHPSAFGKLVGVLGGEVAAGGVACTLLLNLGVAHEIVLEATGHILALGDDAHAGWSVFEYLGQQDGVVGTAQDDAVDVGVERHQLVDALLDEIVGTGTVGLVVLYERNPEGTSHTRDVDVGPELANLHVVAVALHGTLGGEQTHMAVACEMADGLYRGAYHAEHASRGVPLGQVVLLYGAQSLGRGGVAAQDNQLATHAEELEHRLAGEVVDHIKRARTVRRASIVAQEHIVILGQQLAYAMQDGESSVARIEDADRAWSHGQPFAHFRHSLTKVVMSSPKALLA